MFYALSGYYHGVTDFCNGVTWCDGRVFEHSLAVLIREDNPGTVLGLSVTPLVVSVSWKRPPWITSTAQVLEKIPQYDIYGQLSRYDCTVAWTVRIQPNDYGQVFVWKDWGALGTAGQHWLSLDGAQIVPLPAGAHTDDLVPLNDGSVFVAKYGRPPGGYAGHEYQQPMFLFQAGSYLVFSQTSFVDPCR
jgi:hypothetical protein